MAYQKNKPAGSDKFKDSHSDLLGNFELLSNVFKVNHTALETATNSGKHIKVDLTNLGGDATVGSSTEGVIYNKQYTRTNFYEVWYVNNSRSSYPVTGGKRSTSGWSYVGGGNLMAWGSSNGTGDATIQPGIDPVSYPPFNKIHSAQVTTWMQGTSPNNVLVRLKSLQDNAGTVGNPSSITLFCSNLSGASALAGFQWYIIGQPVAGNL